MAYLKEKAKWEDGIYQYELDDPLQGGEDGIDNVQGKQLANRTLYLKEKEAAHEADKKNPHKVTAEQVGAYTKQQTDGIVKSLKTQFDAEKKQFAKNGNVYTKTESDNQFALKTALENLNLSDVFKFKRSVQIQDIDKVIDSGIYSVSHNSRYSGALLVFNTHSSAGIVQFMKDGYNGHIAWEYRNAIDCNTSKWTKWMTFSNSNDISELEKRLEKQMQQTKEAAVKEADTTCRWMLINILKNGYIRWPGTEHPSKVFSSSAWEWRLIYKVSLPPGSVCEGNS